MWIDRKKRGKGRREERKDGRGKRKGGREGGEGRMTYLDYTCKALFRLWLRSGHYQALLECVYVKMLETGTV